VFPVQTGYTARDRPQSLIYRFAIYRFALATERETINHEQWTEIRDEVMLPDEIIDESFRTIEREVGTHSFSADEWPIVRRMIHAAGDLELARAVVFRNDAARKGLSALCAGLPLITDVKMVATGINQVTLDKLGGRVHCFIDDPEVKRRAIAEETTRSYCAMKQALARFPGGIFVIGNAPTALVAVCEAVRQKQARPALICAMPVGFVGVLESKAQALDLEVPVIAVAGRKGGSAVAAAAVNAMMLLALEARRP
jgi:precorrin-8X/cobalt-precorrin-8 methylmutase